MTTLYILTAVFIISLTAFVGILTLSFKEEKIKKIIPFLVALSTGALLGGFFIHLLPKLEMMSIKKNIDFQNLTYLILVGILLFFIIEKVLHLHHNANRNKCESCQQNKIKTSGYLILFSDAFHNFLDGVAIASAFLTDIHLGVITTIVIFAHELPQEIGDFGILLNAGFEKMKALWFNFLSGLTAILGAILTIFASNFIQNIGIYLTALAGGSFIYLALASLIPELHNHKHDKKSQIVIEFLFVLLGILIMWLVKEFAHHH